MSDNKLKTIYINFNLVFDYNSLLFCVLRSYLLSKGFHLSNNQRNRFELKTPCEAFKAIPEDQKNGDFIEQDFLDLFSANSKAIKPIIGAIDTVLYLKTQGFVINLYTDIQVIFDSVALDHKEWLGESQLIKVDSPESLLQRDNILLICDGNMEFIASLAQVMNRSEPMIFKPKLIYIRNEDYHNKDRDFTAKESDISAQKWEDLKWVQILPNIIDREHEISFAAPEYFLQLNRNPSGNDMLGYISSIPLDNPVVCVSTVIAGQGKASKELGIPTANLEVSAEIAHKVQFLLTGVYLGRAILKEKEYKALYFVGSSQYFENGQKQVECYLYNEFEENFYGDQIKCEITAFSRPEADFKQFGMFFFLNKVGCTFIQFIKTISYEQYTAIMHKGQSITDNNPTFSHVYMWSD